MHLFLESLDQKPAISRAMQFNDSKGLFGSPFGQLPARGFDEKAAFDRQRSVSGERSLRHQPEKLPGRAAEAFRLLAIAPAELIEKQFLDVVFRNQRQTEPGSEISAKRGLSRTRQSIDDQEPRNGIDSGVCG